MASDLAADLRAAVKNGFLYVSLTKLWDGPLWECSYRTTDSTATYSAQDADPAEALSKALRSGTRETRKLAPPRRREADDLA